MKAKDFIELKLKELASKYKDVQIRYEYRATTQSHIVEVIPLSFFEENEDYLLEEGNLEDEFENLYPQENIVFISEGSLTEIKNADLEIGYDKITVDYSINIEFEIEGFTSIVDANEVENYALAA